jgi:hypothetical protein
MWSEETPETHWFQQVLSADLIKLVHRNEGFGKNVKNQNIRIGNIKKAPTFLVFESKSGVASFTGSAVTRACCFGGCCG